jgi:arsenite methyltransferase
VGAGLRLRPGSPAANGPVVALEAFGGGPKLSRSPCCCGRSITDVMTESDRWARWLLTGRDGGNGTQREVTMRFLDTVAERVLAGAGELRSKTVLDVGAGDGLIGLAAISAVGVDGKVIFSDISGPALREAERRVRAQPSPIRTEFVIARATDLEAIADASVDVVTTRSVLLYVAKRQRAFAAMFRVLRPGGRISLFEPINRRMFPEPGDRFFGYDVSGVARLADKVKAEFALLHDPAAETMRDYDEGDLLTLAEEAGFTPVHLECDVDIESDPRHGAVSLSALLASAPNPLAPALGEAVDRALAGDEREQFLQHLGNSVKAGAYRWRRVAAYVSATKPSTPDAER